MKRLAEVKDSLDIDVKQNFIDPLQGLNDKDLREIQVIPLMSYFKPENVTFHHIRLCHQMPPCQKVEEIVLNNSLIVTVIGP